MFDCNLAVDQMSLLLTSAKRRNIPAVVAAVSDSKVVRLLQLGTHEPIDLIVLNKLELAAITDSSTAQNAKDVCARLQAKHVVLTAGSDGYTAMSESGSSKHYQAPPVDRIVSQSGAGDALLSGILTQWYDQQFLDFDNAISIIATSVRRVLEQPGATRGSLATDIDFARLARVAIRNEPLWKRFLSPEMGVAMAIIIVLLTVPLLIFTYKLLPSPSPTPPTSNTAAPITVPATSPK